MNILQIQKADREALKAELERLKDREAKLRLQNLKSKPFTWSTDLTYSIIGQALAPQIHKVAQDYAIRRTHTGKFKVHGRTYRTKKLAEKAWRQDTATLFNIGSNRKSGKRDLVENLIVTAGNFTFFGFPQIMKWVNEYTATKNN